MKTKSLLLASLMMFFLSNVASAQIMFQKTYGGLNNDEAQSIQQTSDGGFIIVGYTASFGGGNNDIYLIKTAPNGDTLWTKTYGGTSDDYGYDVQQTNDDGYIIVGSTFSFGEGNDDVFLIRTNANGSVLWTKTHGGPSKDIGYSVQQTTDKGYIIVGSTSSFDYPNIDVYLIKCDSVGNTLWTKTYGGANTDIGYSVVETSDGGYAVLGITNSFGAGNVDIYLIKTAANGDTIWTKTFGGINDDYGKSIQKTTDGGFIIGGYTNSFGAGNYDICLIKTTLNGDILWTKTYGGTTHDDGGLIKQTADGGYIIGGLTWSFDVGMGHLDYYLIKIDAIGDTIWSKAYGGTEMDLCNSIQQTSDGGYIIAGYTSSFGSGQRDFYLVKTDANGESGCHQVNIPTITNSAATLSSNTSTIVTSQIYIIHYQNVIVSCGGQITTLCPDVGINEMIAKPILFIFPNPTSTSSSTFTLQLPPDFTPATLQIFTTLGAMVYEQNITQASTLIQLNKAAGIYFVKVDDGDKVVMGKLVMQ